MLKPNKTSRPLATSPVYLTAQAINHVIGTLPASTAYFIGIVLITMGTGQLGHHHGSLARAALPYVVHCAGAGIGSNGRWRAARCRWTPSWSGR